MTVVFEGILMTVVLEGILMTVAFGRSFKDSCFWKEF